jgi:DNA adenine methylase
MYLKWIGGKSSIAPELIFRFPGQDIKTYIEPFIGSGAMYFAFLSTMVEVNLFYKTPTVFCLSDANPFLINCHSEIKENIDKVCQELEKLEREHNDATDKKAFYYSIRNLVTDPHALTFNPTVLAAHFVYINKTCFNGIWRVNKLGRFNVPFNNHVKLKFDYDLIRKASSLLKRADLYIQEFDQVDDSILADQAFCYMDPPYVPLTATSSFTSYTAGGFGPKELQRLVAFCEKLDSLGTKWMVSNSSAPAVYEAFKKWNISEIKVHRFVRAIKNKNETREKVAETVITNY